MGGKHTGHGHPYVLNSAGSFCCEARSPTHQQLELQLDFTLTLTVFYRGSNVKTFPIWLLQLPSNTSWVTTQSSMSTQTLWFLRMQSSVTSTASKQIHKSASGKKTEETTSVYFSIKLIQWQSSAHQGVDCKQKALKALCTNLPTWKHKGLNNRAQVVDQSVTSLTPHLHHHCSFSSRDLTNQSLSL